MKALHITILAAVLLYGVSKAQFDVSVEEKSEHSNWGTAWGTMYVVKNNLVTLAVVPTLGGRVMQYDLGNHAAIYVNEDEIETVPVSGNTLIGGFRQLPSPQSDFGWPSPPEVDLNPYTCNVRVNNGDSAVIYLESDVVNNTNDIYITHQGMQFKRLLTLYKASTRVKVEMIMLNTGSSSMVHGIWDITQCICSNNGVGDLENIWVYFKTNPSSSMNGGYVQYAEQGDGDEAVQWNPDIAEGGIFGAQFLAKKGKIGADCNAGWICHVDRLDGYAYVKTFTYEEGKTYPDDGASVQVYTYGDISTPTVEVEVLGPLTTLGRNDSVKLIEEWYMARSYGPVLNVTKAGLVTRKLTVQQENNTVTVQGSFGPFYPGTVRTVFLDKSSAQIAVADTTKVSPLDSLLIDKQYEVPVGAVRLSLNLYNSSGEFVGILDSVTVQAIVGSGNRRLAAKQPGFTFVARQHENDITVSVHQRGDFEFSIFSIDGKKIVSFTGREQGRHSLGLAGTLSRLYIAQLKTSDGVFSKKVYLHR